MNARKLSVLAAAFLVIAPAAHAQTVDYTAAEQMFGEPVTASAIGKPQRASEAPANIDIITADDIRRSGATDIPSILRFVPGLDVRRYGQFDAAVGIRGYNTALNPRVLVLLDGRQVYQDDYGYTLWSQIPVALGEIRQIEIIKGPNAALYGFNAVSGVINIVTFDPLRDRKNAVDMRGGTQGQAYGEGVATIQVPDRFGLRASVKGTRADEFEGKSVLDDAEKPNVKTGAADMRYRLNDHVELGVSASIGGIETEYYPDFGSYIAMDTKTQSLRGVLTADTSLGLLQLDAYRNATDFSSSGWIYDLGWRQDVTVVKASDLVRVGGDHTLRIGAEYRHNSLKDDDFFGGETSTDLVAGSVMWNWQIRPDLVVTNAVRLDAMSVRKNDTPEEFDQTQDDVDYPDIVQPSFNSALLYSPTDFDTFRLSAARALQLPSLVTLSYYYRLSPFFEELAPLRPSAVMNYEAGYSRELPSLDSQFNFSLFVQDTDKTIGSPFALPLIFTREDELVSLSRNFAGSGAVGGEIGIDGRNEAGWRWNLSYSLASLNDRTSADILSLIPAIDYAVQNPVHSVIAGLGFTWDRLEVDGQARWQSSFKDFRFDEATFGSAAENVPDYVTLNARAGYKVTDQATFSVTAEQLNAARIVTSAGRRSERRLLAGLKIEF
ncbi:TonB-dependent receptor plug domain-containing protein [Aureimonas psammosilenae]|uniref:TonB-dependent receptor plug domain-containing protein n=1 Tax=Aureimonas psammosilenae TaxID=2495496 RepID=UPI00126130F3|nr:TonB-dependent receptor [Aureimonas psammosilenae]